MLDFKASPNAFKPLKTALVSTGSRLILHSIHCQAASEPRNVELGSRFRARGQNVSKRRKNSSIVLHFHHENVKLFKQIKQEVILQFLGSSLFDQLLFSWKFLDFCGYGMIIISEQFLEDKEKTIQPRTDVPGRAGGKYVLSAMISEQIFSLF